MAHHELILAQSETSPYADLLEQALRLELAVTVPRVSGVAQLAALGQESPALVIWDLSGFDMDEAEALAQLLVLGQVGVMLICPSVEQLPRDLLERLNPVALLVDPRTIYQVSAALEVARNTHYRIRALQMELQRLGEELADRMLVERAKRTLMAARGLSEAQAMAQLQTYARNTNQRLALVARRILTAYRVFNGLHDGEEEPEGGGDS